MNRLPGQLGWQRAAGLVVVLALHAGVLYGLWSARVIPPPAEVVPLFVNLINPAAVPPPPPPKPVRHETPTPAKPAQHLATTAPVVSPDETVEPSPPPMFVTAPFSPAPPAFPPAPPRPAGPVTLESELAVVCPERSPPSYPPMARRLGETGKVVLRVELDETGRVSAVQVVTGSGFSRLDAAALATVRTWRCQPAQRDGQAVRSVAVQPFNFTLEGR